MPEISRFYGIVIKMYFDDHHPPHFHAEYGESELVMNIETLAVIAGNLTPQAMGRILTMLENSPPFKAAIAIKPLRSSFLNAMVKSLKGARA